MNRLLFNTACSLSLLAFAAALMCWGVSGKRRQLANWTARDGSETYLVLRRNQFHLVQQWVVPQPKMPFIVKMVWQRITIIDSRDNHYSLVGGNYAPTRELLGFQYGNSPFGSMGVNGMTYAGRVRFISVPFWFLALLSAVLPTIWFQKRRERRQRSLRNLCTACGYSLTGNTSGVCPECGAKVSSPENPSAG